MSSASTDSRPCIVTLFDLWLDESAIVDLTVTPPKLQGGSGVKENALRLVSALGSGVLYWNERDGMHRLQNLVSYLSYWKKEAVRADLNEVEFANELLRYWLLQLLLRDETPPLHLHMIMAETKFGDLESGWSTIIEELVAYSKERFKIKW